MPSCIHHCDVIFSPLRQQIDHEAAIRQTNERLRRKVKARDALRSGAGEGECGGGKYESVGRGRWGGGVIVNVSGLGGGFCLCS